LDDPFPSPAIVPFITLIIADLVIVLLGINLLKLLFPSFLLLRLSTRLL
jgi:hypothetical protein